MTAPSFQELCQAVQKQLRESQSEHRRHNASSVFSAFTGSQPKITSIVIKWLDEQPDTIWKRDPYPTFSAAMAFTTLRGYLTSAFDKLQYMQSVAPWFNAREFVTTHSLRPDAQAIRLTLSTFLAVEEASLTALVEKLVQAITN